MAVDQDTVSKILSVLSHPLRRQILQYLSENQESTFTDLLNYLHVDTGKLSFHIRNLSVFLEQTESGKYKLSRVGNDAIVFIRDVEAWAVETGLTQKASTLPIAAPTKRVFAFLIDFAVSLTLFLALPNGISSLVSGTSFFLNFNILLYLSLFWVYLTLLEGFAGQTLGKRIIGLKVVKTDGKNIFYDHSAVRNFGKVFLLPVDLYFGYRLKALQYLRYFDKFTGTTVVDLRPSLSEPETEPAISEPVEQPEVVEPQVHREENLTNASNSLRNKT